MIRQWSDRKKKIDAQLFPSYVFVKVIGYGRHSLFTVKDLVGFVSFENKPVVAKERETEAIKMVLNEEIEICDFAHFDIAESVRICKGSLAVLEGTVIKQNSKVKLLIRIEYFQKAIAVNIPTVYAEVVGVHNANMPKQ
ncbi:MAG: transcription termination/antitermination protein NusG [Flammeovirgaceae bacterium]